MAKIGDRVIVNMRLSGHIKEDLGDAWLLEINELTYRDTIHATLVITKSKVKK